MDSPGDGSMNSDAGLLMALRRRLVQGQGQPTQGDSEKLADNIYGSGTILPGQSGLGQMEGGLMDRLGGGSSGPSPRGVASQMQGPTPPQQGAGSLLDPRLQNRR